MTIFRLDYDRKIFTPMNLNLKKEEFGLYLCHQFLQYFILYQLWVVDLKHVLRLGKQLELDLFLSTFPWHL